MLVDLEFSMLAYKIKAAGLKYTNIRHQKNKQEKEEQDKQDYESSNIFDEIDDKLKQVNLTKGKKRIETKITYELEEETKKKIEGLHNKITIF